MTTKFSIEGPSICSWIFWPVKCYFRNLVHTVYREARHIGPVGDPEAKLKVVDGPYAQAAKKCRDARQLLKGVGLFKTTESAKTATEALRPYMAPFHCDSVEVGVGRKCNVTKSASSKVVVNAYAGNGQVQHECGHSQ